MGQQKTGLLMFFLCGFAVLTALPVWGQNRSPLAYPQFVGPDGVPGFTSPADALMTQRTIGSITGVSGGSPAYPPNIQWMQITTPRQRFIFPEGYEEEASRAAAVAMEVWPNIEEDLETQMPRLPIILNTSNLVSNGYATLAPRRTEWYGVNSQSQIAGPVDWYTLLALHEGRHAAQFAALDQGFTRFARYAAGEYGWSFFSMYSVPLWFFEGDAIMAETLFSEAGRGRSAAFHREFRGILEDDIDISYTQAYLGSYRSHFPSHYHLGFPLTAYVRLVYGQEAWREILEETSRFSFFPLRFHRAVKKVTGRGMSELYEDALEYYRSYFRSETGLPADSVLKSGTDLSPDSSLSPDPGGIESTVSHKPELPVSGWTNYLPVAGDGDRAAAGEDGFYAVRHGDEHPWALVKVNSGTSERVEVITPLPAGERCVSVSGGIAVWTERIRHPLWSEVASSEIVCHELESGKRRILTGEDDRPSGEEGSSDGEIKHRGNRGSYQSPALSPEGKRIAAVYAKPGGGAELRILSSKTGEVLDTHLPGSSFPGGEMDSPIFILQPSWSADGQRVVAVEVSGGRSSVVEYGIGEGGGKGSRTLLGPVKGTISRPVYYRDYVLYVAEAGAMVGGKERIEAIDREKGNRYTVASGDIAASYPVPVLSQDGDEDILVFADYTAEGFRAARITLDVKEFTPLPRFFDQSSGSADYGSVDYIERIEKELPEESISDGGSSRGVDEFEVENYNRASHLFNFHSWGMVPSGDGRAELFLRSDDVLGLFSLRPFAGFNIRNETWDTGVEGVYRGIYPLIRFRVSADTFRPTDPDTRRNGISGQLGVEAPVDMSRGVWHRQLSFGTTGFIRYREEYFTMPVSHGAAFYRASKAFAPIDFAPPLEQFLRGVWLHMPFGMDQRGGRLVSEGYLTFPGIGAHHRFRVTGGGEWQYGERVPLSYPAVKPRGYTPEWGDAYEFNAAAGLEYQLPLIYPDLEMGHVYYLKGIRGTLFTELGAGMRKDASGGGTDSGGNETPAPWITAGGAELFPVSGLEILFEQHLFSWPVVFEGGIRLLYRWGDGAFRLEDTVFTLGLEW
ncbi:MAG: hypothetical protein ACLFMZ_08585 [Spirochaetaceae bacterium]